MRIPAADPRKTVLAVVLAGLLLLSARHVLALSQLLYTYVAFPLKHTHVLSVDDAFDLRNLSRHAAPPVVPRIIHQVQLGNITMRPSWAAARAACLALHPPSSGWDIRTWDDDAADAFVASTYPELYKTYRGYPYEIQRTNILRYLLLHHYGGIYMDLDLKCMEKLDGLLSVEFLTPPANPTGVNNAFIVAKPGHGFLEFVVQHVVKFDLHWGMPYVTNMFSTGCQFWSTMHTLYPHREELSVLPQEYKLNGHVLTPLFEHLGASSWHQSDARAILAIGRLIESIKSSPLLLCLVLFSTAASVFLLAAHCRRRRLRKAGREGYSVLPMIRISSEDGERGGRGRRGTVVVVFEDEGSVGSSSGPSSPRSRWSEEKGMP
ncbi:hypothetical protein OE88DRAFT_1664986 [Heliocybe sulcata]|uniref:Glycosyltransferase family 32 protein n=1 Tax=Heliocybe sulcata TaxID=5364 RepID=A0A5C3MRL6_9AGAM|nr:hypothetical protein OE88DRAFT_1664986 [Heliocybe sulcata]